MWSSDDQMPGSDQLDLLRRRRIDVIFCTVPHCKLKLSPAMRISPGVLKVDCWDGRISRPTIDCEIVILKPIF